MFGFGKADQDLVEFGCDNSKSSRINDPKTMLHRLYHTIYACNG